MPNLTTTSLEATKAFYVSVLGFEVVMDVGWIVTVADPRNPRVQLSLITQDATAPMNPAVSIEVSDVDAAYAAAVADGAEIVHPLTDEPWGVRRFFVRDTDGQVVNVLSHSSGPTSGDESETPSAGGLR